MYAPVSLVEQKKSFIRKYIIVYISFSKNTHSDSERRDNPLTRLYLLLALCSQNEFLLSPNTIPFYKEIIKRGLSVLYIEHNGSYTVTGRFLSVDLRCHCY